jgi:solute carrier family 25 phosphate transporter 23/24/25/41
MDANFFSQLWLSRNQKSELSPIERLFVGGSAGIVSVICTYPLDLIRTRLSVQSGPENTRYKGKFGI